MGDWVREEEGLNKLWYYVHLPLIESSCFLCQFDLHMEQVPSDRSYLLSLLTARNINLLLTLMNCCRVRTRLTC